MKHLTMIGASLAAAGALVAGGGTGSGAATGAEALPAEVLALRDAAPDVPALPADGPRALVAAVESLGLALGVPVQAQDAVARAQLSDPVAGRLALLAQGALACHTAGAPVRAAFQRGAEPVPPALAQALRRCAAPLESLALETSAFLRANPAAEGGGMDMWPVLRYSPGESDDSYENDYAILVDQGGNDRYLNNAGGNLLDVRRGPEASPAMEKAPARGCHTIGLDFVAGKTPTDGQCEIGEAVLVDSAGDDTYGMREAPDPVDDGFCTSDPLVRRIVTGGAGFAGVGILVDSAGDDTYVTKTVSMGAGHVDGVGILRDEAGDDSYLSLRNAQGYALAGGLGLLRDDAGNDTFDYYELAPLDPGAGYQRPGSGGVVDDRGTCDRLPRQLQGTALLPGSVGIFLNYGGEDTYRGAPPALQDPGPPFPEKAPHSSQGYGGIGGFGYFLDEGGRDGYTGVPNRYDDLVVNPSPDSSGIFEDKGSIEGGASGTPK